MSLEQSTIEEFKKESLGLLKELNPVVETLEKPSATFPTQLLEEFSQKIDRIMGTVKTLAISDPEHKGLRFLGGMTEICKHMGYKAAASQVAGLIPLYAAFWLDSLEVIEEFIETIDNDSKATHQRKNFAPIPQKRLEWLNEKTDKAMKEKGGAAAAGGATPLGGKAPTGKMLTQAEIDALLNDMIN